ncbi:MAG: hypothetical protein AAF721_04905 [Myxococcota bacterium]
MSLLLSLVLLADPRATAVDFSGGAAVEVRGGRAPLSAGLDPVPSLMTIVAPIGRIHISSRGHDGRAVVSYSPRVLYRVPNLAGLNRPLLLHQTAIGYGRAISPRLRGGISATADVGEVDYTTAQNLFGNQQGELPSAELTSYATTNLTLNLGAALSPTQVLDIVPSFDFRTPYGDSVDNSGDPNALQTLLPRQIGAQLALAHTYRVTPVDSLLAGVSAQYVDFEDRGAFAVVTATYGWGRRITPRLGTVLRGGFFASQETRAPEGVERTFQGSAIQPVLGAEIDGRLYNRSNLRITGTFGATSAGFLDSVSGDVIPRAGVTSSLAFFFPPRWTVGVNANFYTNATREPRASATPAMPGAPIDPSTQQETVLSWRTPVSVALAENIGFEFGTIWSARGPHLRAGSFRFRQLESWGYVAIQFDYASGHLRQRASGGGGSTVSGGAVN